MKSAKRVLVAVVAMAALSACGFHVRPPTPARPLVIAGFEVIYGPQIPPDRRRVLDQLGVGPEMSMALRASYAVGQGPLVRVIITNYYAPHDHRMRTTMSALVQVLDGRNQVLAQFDVHSTSHNGRNRTHHTNRVAQDLVNQIAQRL